MSLVARAEIAQQMKDVAAGVLLGADETTVRLQLLGLALDPKFAAVERAVNARASDLPTTELEAMQGYIAGAIERRLLTGPDPIVLTDLHHDPAAWADAFARACVPSSITELRRNRNRALKESKRDSAAKAPAYWPSADSQMESEREERIADEWVDRIEAASSAWQRESLLAQALLDLHELPDPWFSSPDDRRWVRELCVRSGAGAMLLSSLQAASAVTDGVALEPTHPVDDRLLDLWLDYSSPRASAVMAMRRPLSRRPPSS